MKEHLHIIENIFRYSGIETKIYFEPKSYIIENDCIIVRFNYLIIVWTQIKELTNFCTDNNLQYGIIDDSIIIKSN